MEIKILQNFLVLARMSNMTAAAEFLNLTQPTFSRQLAALEEELGALLFERGGRRLTLTAAGVRLKKRAEEILELVNRTQCEFRQPENELSGDIYLGSGESWVLGRVAEVMKELRALSPRVRFHVFSGDGDEVSERLNNGLLDFGLFIEPASVSAYESIRLPEVDMWGALMLKESPLASREAVAPEDLWHEPIIISKQSYMEWHISKWMRREFSELNIAATYNLLYNASILVRKGLGIALGLDRLINVSNDPEICFRPCKPALPVALYFAWRKQNLFSPAAQAFLTMVLNRFKSA
ncbi:MAG: LysR family transcriptional regulator [Desulfovibrio sp.]|nr:LysR family transcriptional regulator [Desulfovibrio sp.]